jgi:hypothetical protein
MKIGIGRREFLTALGGATVAWPQSTRAQPVERKRHIAVLLGGLAQGDAQGQEEVAAFEESLKQAGWIVGGNIEIDYRWLGAAADRMPAVAKEVADTHPDWCLPAQHRPRPR